MGKYNRVLFVFVAHTLTQDYLTGMCLHLEAIKGDDTASGGAGGGAGAGASASTKTADGVEFRGHVLVVSLSGLPCAHAAANVLVASVPPHASQDDTAVIESGAVIGPNVVVGPNCVVKTGKLACCCWIGCNVSPSLLTLLCARVSVQVHACSAQPCLQVPKSAPTHTSTRLSLVGAPSLAPG